MHSMIARSGFAALALAALLGATSLASAEQLKFKAVINAQQEVPPNPSTATGTADLTYDTVSKNLTWTITFKDLTGDPNVAHFHGPAEAGKNSGVALLIANSPKSPATGSATLTDAQAADLVGGRWYVNIHTAANRGGEIRGQVIK